MREGPVFVHSIARPWNAVVIRRPCRYPERMAAKHPAQPPERFTNEQLAELRTSFDRAEAVRGLPLLPEWYRNLPVPERGLALVLSKTPTR